MSWLVIIVLDGVAFCQTFYFFFFFFLLRFTYYSAVMGARGFLNDDFMVIILERGMRIWISA